MMKRTIVSFACGVIVSSVLLAPGDAFAGGRGGGDAHESWRSSLPQRVASPHHFEPHPFFRGPAVGVGIVVPPVPLYPPPIYTRWPSYYDASIYARSPGYYDMSVYAPPPPTYRPPIPPPPPMPSVIEYPEGRYELRGDGITTPYRWVWIPNPPSGPPPSVPSPSAPPPSAPPPSTTPPPAPGPARQSTLYRWTDEQGAVHWTDRLDAVPERYRSKVTKSQS